MDNTLVSIIFVLLGITQTGAILKWRNSSNSDDSLTIKYIKVEDEEIDNDGYANITRKYRNYTLDEKCDQGLPFGVGFQWYNPYVDMGMTSDHDYSLSGIFPHVTKKIMAHCCPKSQVMYGRHFVSIKEIEESAQEKGDIDLYFPLYAQNGKGSTEYKDFPFITIATAPRIVVLVPDRLFTEINPRVNVIMNTIFNAWPMLIFIFVSTALAGLTVWFLDRKMNSTEFPPTFYQGAWEGIWWAFVTMTTVGYGDRSPRSPCARAFCLLWILVGIVLISFFTGLVTTALSASATPVFNVAGSRIGAVTGSLEYQVGVGYNAEMKAFKNHPEMFHSLQKDLHTMRAVMVDNFILSANSERLTKKMKVRMEREFEVPISYGMALGDQNSKTTFKCFQRYVSHNSHEVFEIISKKLIPINNPTDQTRLEVAQSESLFQDDALLKKLIYVELGILLVMIIAGVLSEKCEMGVFYQKLRKNKSPDELHLRADNCSLSDIKTDATSNGIITTNELQSLLNEYDEYHLKWVHRVRTASKPPPPLFAAKKDFHSDEHEEM